MPNPTQPIDADLRTLIDAAHARLAALTRTYATLSEAMNDAPNDPVLRDLRDRIDAARDDARDWLISRGVY